MILEKYGGPKWYWHEECKMAKYMIFNWACWSFGHSCVKTPPINAKYIDFFFFFFFANKVYRFDFSSTMYINSQILIE